MKTISIIFATLLFIFSKEQMSIMNFQILAAIVLGACGLFALVRSGNRVIDYTVSKAVDEEESKEAAVSNGEVKGFSANQDEHEKYGNAIGA